MFFYKKEAEIRTISATNISFLYFIERFLNFSEYYADIAVNTSWYNAKALLNKDGVQPKTPPFSTQDLIWVKYQFVSQ